MYAKWSGACSNLVIFFGIGETCARAQDFDVSNNFWFLLNRSILAWLLGQIKSPQRRRRRRRRKAVDSSYKLLFKRDRCILRCKTCWKKWKSRWRKYLPRGCHPHGFRQSVLDDHHEPKRERKGRVRERDRERDREREGWSIVISTWSVCGVEIFLSLSLSLTHTHTHTKSLFVFLFEEFSNKTSEKVCLHFCGQQSWNHSKLASTYLPRYALF